MTSWLSSVKLMLSGASWDPFEEAVQGIKGESIPIPHEHAEQMCQGLFSHLSIAGVPEDGGDAFPMGELLLGALPRLKEA